VLRTPCPQCGNSKSTRSRERVWKQRRCRNRMDSVQTVCL
jgi:ribosomal protein L37AE/L43A